MPTNKAQGNLECFQISLLISQIRNPERLNDLSVVTQLVRGDAGLPIWPEALSSIALPPQYHLPWSEKVPVSV